MGLRWTAVVTHRQYEILPIAKGFSAVPKMSHSFTELMGDSALNALRKKLILTWK